MRPAVYERARRRRRTACRCATTRSHPTLDAARRRRRLPLATLHARPSATAARCADLLELEVAGRARASPAILSELRGCAVAGRRGARTRAGGRRRRGSSATRTSHAHDLRASRRPTPARCRRAFSCARRSPRRPTCVDAYRAAFPPEHVDGTARVGKDLQRSSTDMLERGAAGPLLAGQRARGRTTAASSARDPDRHDRRGDAAVRRAVDHRAVPRSRRTAAPAARCSSTRCAAPTGSRLGLAVTRRQPGRAALRGARLPPHLHGVSQSICSARATIAAPSTPAGSVP